MFKSLMVWVRRPEKQQILWGFPLPFWLTFGYLVATWTALLMVTTWRDDSLQNPDALSFILAGILGGVVMVWVIRQNMYNAIYEAQGKLKKADPDLTMQRVLSLKESESRPLWIVWLMALCVVITMDTVAVLLGKPTTSFITGLDRMGDASWASWLLAGILFVLVRPIIEEVIFRGILYPVLAQRLGDNLKAVWVSAALFTGLYLIQVFKTDVDWHMLYWGLIYPLVLGVTAGISRAHTKSTTAAIGTHAMFGLFMVLNALVTFA